MQSHFYGIAVFWHVSIAQNETREIFWRILLGSFHFQLFITVLNFEISDNEFEIKNYSAH